MARFIDVTGTLVIDIRAREWCRLPYPGHKKGCPNYHCSPLCPPHVQVVGEVFDLSQKHWFVVEPFNLGDHARRMRAKHPQWTERQCRNCLYWQSGVRKELRAACEGSFYTLTPEAMGVDVFKTAAKHGIVLERNPQETVYKIALTGQYHD